WSPPAGAPAGWYQMLNHRWGVFSTHRVGVKNTNPSVLPSISSNRAQNGALASFIQSATVTSLQPSRMFGGSDTYGCSASPAPPANSTALPWTPVAQPAPFSSAAAGNAPAEFAAAVPVFSSNL